MNGVAIARSIVKRRVAFGDIWKPSEKINYIPGSPSGVPVFSPASRSLFRAKILEILMLF
jgi:hypothetical protein